MSGLSSRQIEILNALVKSPRVERSREDFLEWQDLEDRGLIYRQSVNVSEMHCEITDKGRLELERK